MAEKHADDSQGWGILHCEGTTLLWWRPEGNGYARRISEAGLFSKTNALIHNGPRHSGADAPVDEAIPPDKMRSRAQEEVRRLETRLGELMAFLRRLNEVTK